MQQTLRSTRWLLLVLPLAELSCSEQTNVITPSATTFEPLAAAAKVSIDRPVRLKQYAVTTRNVTFVDFTYDAQGRQESVWVYNQREGENKRATQPTVMSYDAQGRLTEMGLAWGDPISGTVSVGNMQRQYTYTYEGRTTSISLVADQAIHAVIRCAHERDENGQLLRQVVEYRDGYKNVSAYQYVNGNVVQMDQTITGPGGQVTSRQRNRYEYDTNPNPLFGLMPNNLAQVMQPYVSRNNAVKWTYQSLDESGAVLNTTTLNYTFRYDDKGYPTAFTAGTTYGQYVYYE